VAVTEQLTPEQAALRVAAWRGLEVSIRPLSGGITNHNFVVEVRGEAELPWGGVYVLRIPGAGTDAFIDRKRELQNHLAAAEAGVTPPVLHVLEPEGCTVVPFITGETMHQPTLTGHPENLAKLVDTVAAYHREAAFSNEVRVFDTIRRHVTMADEIGAPLPDDIRGLLDLGERIEQAMARDVPEAAACHNDLLAENFILGQDGRMWVIDWEYGGVNDPYYDLGVLCAENPLTEDEERAVIVRYCDGMDESRYARMMLYKIVSDLWWSLWAMLQARLSHIDFDYFSYGMDRVARLKTNAAHPDFHTWLETV
jgi:thiamine kinase-like enzyme